MGSEATTLQKPSYLGLLNAISLAESAAGVQLEAWADATPNAELACVLRLVAARERSHGDVFCRRIAELGFQLLRGPDPRAGEQLARLADPRISDLEKIPSRDDVEADPFADIRRRMAEGEFDAMTANLLTWYIAEEKDSARRLRDAYQAVRTGGRGAKSRKTSDDVNGPSADAEALMACMTAGFARLEKTLEKLVKAAK